jgi:PKD repeat protein
MDNRDGNWEIYYKRSPDGGNSWGQDIRLTNNSGTSFMANLAANDETGLFLVWRDDRDGNEEIYFKLSKDQGLNWGPDVRLTQDGNVSDQPFVAVSGPQVNVTWYDTRDGNEEIYYKRDTTNGGFIANFTADPVVLCPGESTQFTDKTTWGPTQWQWTFQGGNPSVSSQQNPQVTYISTGSYDVTLVASNAAFSDVITKTGYILVQPDALTAPGTPAGDDEICQYSSNTEYMTSGSPGASFYLWQLTPTAAGQITGTGTTAMVDWNGSFTGNAFIKVMASNICTQSPYSDSLEVVVEPLPDAFNLTGGGAFCAGGDGVEIGLDNSESGVEYQVYLEGIPAGPLVQGTGTAISFGLFTGSGSHSCIGRDTVTLCENQMSNLVEVTAIPLPHAFQVNGGGPYCAGGDGASINLSGSQPDHTYDLYLEGTPTGITLPGTGNPLAFQNVLTPGTYTVLGTENTASCSNLMSGSAEIWIISDPPPAPLPPAGPDTVYSFYTPATEYSIQGSPDALYFEWLLEPPSAGTTSFPDTMNVLITWNPSFIGNAELSARGVNDCGPGEWSDPLDIYIDNTVGIGETDKASSISIYPNPNTGTFNLILQDNRSGSLKINITDAMGRILYCRSIDDLKENMAIPISLNNFPPGLYILQIKNKSGTSNHKVLINKE